MRRWSVTVLTLAAGLGFASGVRAGDKSQFELSDPNLPLFELRALDSRVYGLTLEGTWHKPAKSGAHHYVNVIFPNGRSYSTRVDENPKAVRKLIGESKSGVMTYREVEDSPFRRGEVRCYIPENELARNRVKRGETLKIIVSVGKPVDAAKAAEVISNALEITWPMDRTIARRPPRSRYADPEAADAMPLPGDDRPLEARPAARRTRQSQKGG
jgi:hypothetical protein